MIQWRRRNRETHKMVGKCRLLVQIIVIGKKLAILGYRLNKVVAGRTSWEVILENLNCEAVNLKEKLKTIVTSLECVELALSPWIAQTEIKMVKNLVMVMARDVLFSDISKIKRANTLIYYNNVSYKYYYNSFNQLSEIEE